MLTGETWLAPGAVEVSGGRIVAVGPCGPSEFTGSDGRRWPILAPGFVDLQVNGFAGVDVAAALEARAARSTTGAPPAPLDPAWAQLERALLAHGVSSWCPTLISGPLERYGELAEAVPAVPEVPARGPTRAVAAEPARPQMVGLHLEGPCLAIAGAHDAAHLCPPHRAHPTLVALARHCRVVTVAPELEGAVELTEALCGLGVVVAVGHTAASAGAVRRVVDVGARLATHVFNAMAPIGHRDPGPVVAALTDERLWCSIIVDGHHVDPLVVELAWRSAGASRMVLVTDAIAAAGRAARAPRTRVRLGGREVRVVDGAARLADGTLAGSCLTMDRAVANAVGRCGVALGDALRAASTNPARAAGLVDRGEIRPGQRADLVALDDELSVRATWVGGVLAG